MREYVVLDLETTGISEFSCEIIEIGAWRVTDGVLTDRFHHLVRPLRYLPRDVSSLTGIEMLNLRNCRGAIDILPEFLEFCGDVPLVGYNLPFDYRFLCVHGRTYGIDFSLNGKRMGLDILDFVKRYYRLRSYKLQDVVRYLGVNPDDGVCEGFSFHRALYDAYATKLVYDSLLSIGSPIFVPHLLYKKDTFYGHVGSMGVLPFE